jgi:hypothetical protein
MSVLCIGDKDSAADADTGDGRGRGVMPVLELYEGAGGEGRAGERDECRMDRAFGAAKGEDVTLRSMQA